ncbi:MAG: UDP-N-acetylmuramoyl-L-alanyl-D-glutamate--2,6-diaminopimelate ligase [Phycisphaeraceae bacterium]
MPPASLYDLIQDLPIQVARPGDPIIHDLTDDSRQLTSDSGWLFVHRRSDYPEDLASALHHSPAAILTTPDNQTNVREPIPLLLAEKIDQTLCGQLAERFFNHPAQTLTLAAVTGTNGKSTTVILLQHLLQSAGVTTGLLGTIHNDLISHREPATLTTPGAIDLSRFLARIRDASGKACVYEASSHALHQQRTDHLHPHIAIFTNLTQDHLDYHGDMTTYAAAKARLFESLSPNDHAILNADDPHWPRMARDCPAHLHLSTLRSTQPDHHGFAITSTSRATIHHRTITQTEATLTGPWGTTRTNLPLLGDHNIANLLQSLAAATHLDHLPNNIDQALQATPPVPGRLEPIPNPDFPVANTASLADFQQAHQAPAIFVDYCHTPDSIDHAANTLRPLAPGRLIILFGCGGDRDKTKRLLMATAAARHADALIITSDNPRSEDPQAIINDAIAGVPESIRPHTTTNPDRAAAIRQAILYAQPTDTILIAGKGHETYQETQGVKHPFDDRQHAQQTLEQRLQHS